MMTCKAHFFFFPMTASRLLHGHRSCYAGLAHANHIRVILSSSVHVLVSLQTDGHVQLLVTSGLQAMWAGKGREGWERLGRPGLCLSPPKHFPFVSLLPVKKHLSALHCISLFKHEGKPFGGYLVVSYETQTQVTSGSDISMWLEALKGSIFLMPYSLLTCVNLCDPVIHSPAPYQTSQCGAPQGTAVGDLLSSMCVLCRGLTS